MKLVCHIFIGLFAVIPTILAKPRPPLPPFPESTTLHASFDQTNFAEGVLHAEGVRMADSWSGFALNVGDQGFMAWAGTTADGKRPLVSQDQGTIRFWYCSSTNAAATDAVLFEMATWSTKGSVPWLTMHVTPDAIGLSAGGQIVLGASKDWQHGTWHLVALTYSPQATVLYLDGQIVARGAGVQAPRVVARGTFGLSLGSASDGTMQAPGAYDELATFSKPASAEDIARYYQWTAPIAALGPITPAEEEANLQRIANLRAQRMTLEAQVSPFALMQQQMDSLSDLTNGPLRLTNIVWAATNDVSMQVACSTNAPYDVFRTINLLGDHFTNSICVRVAQNVYPGDTITLTNEPSTNAFYIAASVNDSDGDGLSDAYEALVTRTNVNVAPSVSIISPTNNTSLTAPASLSIQVTASNWAFTANIDLYANGQLLASAATSPAVFGWTDVQVGTYDLKAIVTDGWGAKATSSVVRVTVDIPAKSALKVWLKADALSLTNQAPVSQWTDNSGNNNHATGSGSSRPTFLTNQVNGLPAIVFDGINDYLILPNFLQAVGAAEAFVVLRPDNDYLSGPLWTFSTASSYTSYNTNGINDSFGRSSVMSFGNGIGALSAFHVYNVAAASNQWQASVNGSLLVSTNNLNLGFTSSPSLGRCPSDAQWAYGKPKIAEILIYTNILTDLDRTTVGRYLTAKYGLAINPAGTVTNLHCDAPTTNDIRLTWGAVSNANAFVISRSIGSQLPSIITTVPTNTFSFTDPISSASAIVYTVSAVNYAGAKNAVLSTPIVAATSPASGTTVWVDNSLSVALRQHGGNSLSKIEVYRDTRLISTQSAPAAPGVPNYGITLSSAGPTRWDIFIKAIDIEGNYRWSPTYTFYAVGATDMDSDGVADAQDAFPWDPLRWQAPGTAGETNAPVITITEP